MRVALGADEDLPLVGALAAYLEEKGHAVATYGAAKGTVEPWALTAVDVAEAVARGQAELGVVCCWTGTGVSIAANKVRGIRAALCGDAATAAGARKWNDANVLALSLRATTPAVAREILDAWLGTPYSGTEDESLRVIDRRNAFIMDSMMQDTTRSGTAARAARLGRSDLAGKTGTTNEFVDAWFAGYQPTLVAVAWVGFDQPRTLGKNQTGGVVALPIWVGYMERILSDVPDAPRTFESLKSQGVLVKQLHPGMKNCLRITVGTPDENRILLSALKESV